MRFSYLDAAPPIAISHRGGNEVAPENTAAAFEHSLSLGYRYLETDVHLSSDGIRVAFHDADLARIAGLPGSINDQTWDVLQMIDLGDGNRIPTLAELLVSFPDARFNIDPKADNTVEPLADLLDELGAVDRVGIGSFDDARITRLQERLGPRLCTSPGPAELFAYISADVKPTVAFATHGCLQIPPRFGQFELSAGLLGSAHDLGLQVHVWTINEPAQMQELLDLGVDAVMTDKVAVLKDVLIERDQWSPYPEKLT